MGRHSHADSARSVAPSSRLPRWGDAIPTVEGFAALLGGTLAAGTHFTKASTRAVANTSPEPFSNWALSLAEDAFVIGLSTLALKYPLAAAVVVIVGVVVMVWFATWIVRGVRRRWQRPAVSGSWELRVGAGAGGRGAGSYFARV